MSIYDSKLWLLDVDEVVDNFPELKKIGCASVLITGATGLIGSAIIDVILRFNERNVGKEIKIIAAGRSEEKFRRRFSKYVGRSYLSFTFYDATKDHKLHISCDYIIHGASNTLPSTYVNEAAETMIGNFIGMRNLLEYARVNAIKRVLYISSSEIYGKKSEDHPYEEDEYGYIDLLNPRSSYAMSKRATETLCVSYALEYGLETVIVRPGHIYGPTASAKDSRVASLWAYAAANQRDIVMKSDGVQVRSYCYCLDCATAILKTLIEGENCRAYNISNSNSIISIKDMAQILAKNGNVKLLINIPDEEEKKFFNPMRNSSLNSASLEALGWGGLFDAERGFSHTVTILREVGNWMDS